MSTVIVVGGGFGGCAAALAAAKAGAEAILLERTDTLLGVGHLAGILGGNGSRTAILEAKAMGGGDLYEACEAVTLHEIDYIERFDLRHVSIFNVLTIEQEIKKALARAGVKVCFKARASNVQMKGDRLLKVLLDDGTGIEGGAFVDATGATGGVEGCTKYGYGCAMCSLRCPSFGDRVSIAAKAGVKELAVKREDGRLGSLSRAIMYVKESLGRSVLDPLEKKGYLVMTIGQDQYVRIVHNGYVKISGRAFIPLEELHAVPGFENAVLADPLAAGMGNLVTLLAMAPRDETMKVKGIKNLYCAGEMAGPKAEIACVVASGLLAGHNAVRHCQGKDGLVLPNATALGHFIAFESCEMAKEEGLSTGYGFDAGVYFQAMKEAGLYSTDAKEVTDRVEKAGLREVFARRVA